jgi:hypothetical protein
VRGRGYRFALERTDSNANGEPAEQAESGEPQSSGT